MSELLWVLLAIICGYILAWVIVVGVLTYSVVWLIRESREWRQESCEQLNKEWRR